jgi:hypothetical protein
LYLELVGFLGDVLLENLGLGCLRVAKVHHLVEEFVYDNEVVADRLLLQGLEVLCEDIDELVQEEEYLGGIRVSFRQGEEVEVVVADVEVLGRMESGQSVAGPGKRAGHKGQRHTLIPSCEKQGGTADDSSSASLSRVGNFSTADMGISPL